MSSEFLYLYGLMAPDAQLSQGLPAVAAPAAESRLLRFAAVAVIVSPIDVAEVDPVRRNMLAHARVLEAALTTQAVLPMRFGMIVEGEAALGSLIERNFELIEADLARLHGAIEVGLKARWNPGRLWKRIAGSDPALAADCARLNKGDANRGHFDRLEAGRRIDALMARLRAEDAARLDTAMRPFVKVGKTLPPGDAMTFLNRALLVPREAEPSLYAEIARFSESRDEAIDIRYVAPAPAYNFVDLRLSAHALRPEAAR